MKPEIYYDQENIDLVWLPKHSKLVADVAQELYANGIYIYDNPIRGLDRPRQKSILNYKDYFPYVAWTTFNPEPLLNHPKIKEALAMSNKKIEVPEQFIKDLYEIKCVPDLKEALEKNFGEVVRPIPEIQPRTLNAFIGMNSPWPYLVFDMESKGDNVINLHHYQTGIFRPQSGLSMSLRPMRSGTITIAVRNGKVAGAEVRED